MVLRIGTLGAARITPPALLKPAQKVDGVSVVAVAARDPQRAAEWARKKGVPSVRASYDELLADPEIDAVYNPLPNGLHAEWTIKALEAGKHVLCEKPFTSNAAEAEAVEAAAERTGLVCMEAFHWRYHDLAQRLVDLCRGGGLGELRRINAFMCIPLPKFSDIRYQWALGGGALMDVGAYTTHMTRTMAGAEPEVVSARVKTAKDPRIDRWATADLTFPTVPGLQATMTCSLWEPRTPLKVGLTISGSEGDVKVLNATAPQLYSRARKRSKGGSWEKIPTTGEATYVAQLRAFLAAVRDGAPTLTPPAESVANMRVIDAVYRAAGLPVRGDASAD